MTSVNFELFLRARLHQNTMKNITQEQGFTTE